MNHLWDTSLPVLHIWILLNVVLGKIAEVLSDWMKSIGGVGVGGESNLQLFLQTVNQIEVWALTGPCLHLHVLSF